MRICFLNPFKAGILVICISVMMIFASSCAGIYRKRKIENYDFLNFNSNDESKIWYFYEINVMKANHNRKYNNKEKRNFVHLVAVKIINRSDKPITLSLDNFKVFDKSSEYPLNLITAEDYFDDVKQKSCLFGLYTCTPYCIGAPIGFVNFLVALNANHKLKKDIYQNELIGKTLLPKTPEFGYIFIRSDEIETLRLVLEREPPKSE